MKKAGNLFVTAYLLLMTAVYPFFMKQGYADLGDEKYQFFIYCSMGALVIFSVIALTAGLLRLIAYCKAKEAYLVDWDRMSVTDLFVVLYAAAIYFSYLFSDYRQEALWGARGWYIGLVPLLLLCALYFFVSRMWDGRPWIWLIALSASGVVFLLGLLDSFSLYILPIHNREPGFISTLGNINWFCGYLSVLAPIGIGIFLMTDKCLLRWAAGAYTFITFMAGFAQGSSSIFLFFGAVLYFYLWIGLKKRHWLENWFLLLSLFGFSSQGVRILRSLLPGYYNYDTNNLCGYLTSTNGLLLLGAGSLCAYLALVRKGGRQEIGENARRRAHKIMAALPAVLVSGWLAAGALNTIAGIPVFAGNELFTFNQSWGNGRGVAYAAGFYMFQEMPWIHKLLGVGPDCFASYAYSFPELAAELRSWFGADRLVNAHNELLTGLINTGILGAGCFAGIFLSFIARCMKRGMHQPLLFMTAVCAGCYLVHNTVSFAQVLNLPFAFCIMGMGEKMLRDGQGQMVRCRQEKA